jgi:hypothetical protein
MPPYHSPVLHLNRVVQYPDLTELISSSNFADDRLTAEVVQSKVTTEFAFATTVNRTGKWTEGLGILGLIRNGFEPISAMKNWYGVHQRDRWPIVFWWKRIHTGPDVALQTANRTWWCSESALGLHASGCGFKIAEPPLLSERYHQYFTLLRMPKKVGGIQIKWMADHNYRMIALGTHANFWLNGWDPKAWSYMREIEYFDAYGEAKNDKVEAKSANQAVVA